MPLDGSAIPDPKPVRAPRRYRRKVASPKQWAAIRAEKLMWGYCRICGRSRLEPQAHHLVSRARGGDDVADNIVGLCRPCHDAVTRNRPEYLALLASLLTDAEYAYCVGKLGENALERLFGAGR